MNEKIYLSKEGYEEYLEKIDNMLEKLTNNSKIKSSSYEEAVGDGWHDNFTFEEAKREEISLIEEINLAKQKIKNIKIIEEIITNDNLVKINDIVKLKIIIDNEEEINNYKLIGGYFPQEKQNFFEITLNSPIGKAIYKKEIKSKIEYSINNNLKGTVEIIEKVNI